MGLKDVMRYLQQRDAVTPVTPEKIMGLQRESSVYAGCTPVTPVTPLFGDTQENAQLGPLGEASNDPDPQPAKPTPAPRQTYQQWVQTWQPLADAYHLHHFACATCIASGKGYGLRCGVGASLWASYCDAPTNPGEQPHKGDRND
jgi:hypothetical protein